GVWTIAPDSSGNHGARPIRKVVVQKNHVRLRLLGQCYSFGSRNRQSSHFNLRVPAQCELQAIRHHPMVFDDHDADYLVTHGTVLLACSGGSHSLSSPSGSTI